MSDSKMFDYNAGKSEGALAAAEAALEHTAGYLGVELEENYKLRAEIERLRSALKPFVDAAADATGYLDDHPVGCDPAMHLAIEIEDGEYTPLKVLHLRSAAIAYEQKTPQP